MTPSDDFARGHSVARWVGITALAFGGLFGCTDSAGESGKSDGGGPSGGQAGAGGQSGSAGGGAAGMGSGGAAGTNGGAAGNSSGAMGGGAGTGSAARCRDGDGRCNAEKPEVCSNGAWEAAAACPSDTPVCQVGRCVPRRLAVGGTQHTCALWDEGQVKCWGITQSLGLDGTSHGQEAASMGENLPALDLGTGALALRLSTGGGSTCAVLEDGRLKCWGAAGSGQSGLGDMVIRGDDPGEMGDALPALDLGTGRSAISASGGFQHQCALLDDGHVKCWGDNQASELGIPGGNRGDNVNEMGDALPALDFGTDAPIRGVYVLSLHSCAIFGDGEVKCWGSTEQGALGLGTIPVNTTEGRVVADSQMVELGTGRVARSLAGGGAFSCALLDGGDVKCWGKNDLGQLGQGDTESRGDEAGELGDALPAIDLGAGRTALTIAGGNTSMCALLDTHQVKCWGGNARGQLGLGDTENRGDGPGEMGDSLPVVDLGSNRSAIGIFLGASHACAVLDNGELKCWGWNYDAQLGVGGHDSRGDAAGEMGDAMPPVDTGF